MSNVRSTGKKSSNTLVRDLVNVGIFSALYIVLGFMSSSIGYIPALIVFSTASIALVTSVPMFLFYSKIERPILCCMLFCGIFGGAMLVMGQSIIMFAISLAVGLLSGTILKIIGKNFAGLYMANIVMNSIKPRPACATKVTLRSWRNFLTVSGPWSEFTPSASWVPLSVDSWPAAS